MIGFLDLIITEKCNSRCRICSIWREGKKTKNELSKDDIKAILESDAAKSVKCVDLSGGEPFLREDLVDIIKMIKEYLPDVVISISTNGLDTEKILDNLEKIREICDADLRISLDGLEETHNAQRGLDDAFERTMGNVEEINKKYNDQHITFIFVATPQNYKDLVKTYKLVKSINPKYGFLATVAQEVSNYKTYQKDPKEVDYKERFEFSQKEGVKKQFEMLYEEYLKENDFVNAFFVSHIPAYLETGKVFFCDVPENVAVVLPSKLVYNCIMMDSVGDLNKEGLDKIINSNKANDVKKICKEGKCPGCMLFMGSHISYPKIYRLFEYYCNHRKIINKNEITRLDLDKPVENLMDKDKVFLSFIIKKPSAESGERIKKIIHKLKDNGKEVIITRPLPRCVIGLKDSSFMKEMKIPHSCSDCYELFLKGDGVGLCKFLEKKVPLGLMTEPERFFSKAEAVSPKNSKCASCNKLLKIKCKSPCFDYDG